MLRKRDGTPDKRHRCKGNNIITFAQEMWGLYYVAVIGEIWMCFIMLFLLVRQVVISHELLTNVPSNHKCPSSTLNKRNIFT